ncbi:hypothetical protein I4U23_028427 [Adineta vaga]|nr:hypothetical protein I4U23_028427 [Adineta vaga]
MCESSVKEFIPNEIRSNIAQPSLQRRFIGDLSEKSEEFRINVLQWNILAQALSYPEGNFNRVQDDMVKYETRKWRILEQILIHQPDLCPDGVLLCFKTNVFKEISRKNSDLPNDGRFGRQVFSILELEYLPLASRVILIGTHFKAKKQFASSRTNQANALIDFIRSTYSKETNIIVAGDFNGEPDEPCYDVLIKSGFNSAYRTLMNGHEPSYTTWKFKSREEQNEKEESRTIDYIFYRAENLTPIAYLAFPDKRSIGPNGLPSANYPSDHLALQIVFRIQK